MGRAKPKRTIIIVHLGSEVTYLPLVIQLYLQLSSISKLILDGSDTTNAKQ